MTFNFNGEMRSGEHLELGIGNRALSFGDGVFETIKYSNGRLNFWEDHYFRLMAAMRIVRMEIPMSFSPEYLEQKIRETVEANGLIDGSARVKLLVWRSGSGHYTPEVNDVDFMITVQKLQDQAFVLNENGLEIELFKDFHKPKGLLSNYKSTSSQLLVVASVFKKENDLDDCILINDDKHVVEATSSNLFMVKDNKVYTPPLSTGCLRGITRKKVMEILPKLDYEVVEEAFSPFELQRADEVFLTNSVHGIQWVGKYRKKEYSNDCSVKLTQRLNILAALAEAN